MRRIIRRTEAADTVKRELAAKFEELRLSEMGKFGVMSSSGY